MAGILSVFLAVFAILVISRALKVLNWVWLKPKKIEKFLREQGIKGYSYKFLYGNTKDLASLSNEARSKSMDLSHHIAPRVMPFFYQTVQKFGKFSLIWFGPIPRLLVMDPEMIRDILSNKFGHFEKTRTNPLGKFLVTGLISYEGEKWVKHRRIINPAFHLEKLKMMLPAFNTCCNEMSLQSIYIPGFRFLPTKRNKRMMEIYKEEKAREEVLQVIGRKTPDFDGLSHLKNLTMILYEVLSTKEVAKATREARSKPMELSHQIVSRVLPYVNATVEKFGKVSFIWFGPTPRPQVSSYEKEQKDERNP
ncbi:Cytochrome p450 [Thalictrum thalictroides]|uniref:Cytochrome p450 n=1 Tax=Thalictrum thalictroides TaxID=46969 RepID=A0A7J6WVZ1_THATH|nr:Cytochrome p450 [Thalictrum thalictroides]